MSKGGKSFLIVVVIVLLVLGIVWAVYENYKTEPANINATTDLPDEKLSVLVDSLDPVIKKFDEFSYFDQYGKGTIETYVDLVSFRGED